MILSNGKGSVVLTGTIHNIRYKTVKDGSLPLVTFGVAYRREVGEDGEANSVFFDCQAWRKLADYCNTLSAGTSVLVCGHITEDKWTANDGTERTVKRCTADFILAAPDAATSASHAPKPSKRTPRPADVFHDEPEDDGELPF